METDITTLSEAELRQDLVDSYTDIGVCKLALQRGITEYGDRKSVEDRLRVNEHCVQVISAELQRRGLHSVVVFHR